MKSLSNSDKIKVLIDTKTAYIITFLDNNGKYSVYTGGNIHGIYSYLDMIGDPTTLTTSGQNYNNFGPLYSTNNELASLQTVIAALHMT